MGYIISPRWNSSEMGADGFGLDSRFHAYILYVGVYFCASATISWTCMDRFYSYLAKRQQMMVYICKSFCFAVISRWPTGGCIKLHKATMKGEPS